MPTAIEQVDGNVPVPSDRSALGGSTARCLTDTYQARRGQLETYFDRTAVDVWSRITSDAPVGRVRATVRAGRDRMRATLLSWLPEDLRGARLLDAGCGTGTLAVEAARRGAEVVAIDLSPTLVALARDRQPREIGAGSVDFRVGDMLDASLGRFDFVVAMDSLIHYTATDVLRVLVAMAARTERSILFTFAPRTALLATMHAIGQLFPRGHRSPAIEPMAERTLWRLVESDAGLAGWRVGRTARVAKGFYISQGLELASC
jgi:magnesium-protoporphyrin O-methyltransferase